MTEYQTRQKEIFKAQMLTAIQEVLEYELSPETINTYADVVLNQLLKIITDVVKQYQLMEPKAKTLEGKALEHEAFLYFAIDDITQILEKLAEKQEILDSVKDIVTQAKQKAEVIIPPGTGKPHFEGGSTVVERGRFTERLKLLLYAIQNDCGVMLDQVQVTEGRVNRDMYRRNPYYRVEIPQLDRIVYICDEDENASFVFSQSQIAALGITVEQLDDVTKEEMDNIIASYPQSGAKIHYRGRWKERIVILLTESFEEIALRKKKFTKVEPGVNEGIPHVSHSELDPWQGYWKDENGKHWGTCYIIAHRFTIINTYLKKWLIKNAFPSIEIITLKGTRKPGYCVEDVEEKLRLEGIVKDVEEAESSEEDMGLLPSGKEWPLFFTGQNNKHFGSSHAIALRLEFSLGTIDKYIAENPNLIETILLKKRMKTTPLYAFEDFIAIPKIAETLSHPRLAKTGEWAGFFTDEEGRHWALVDDIAKKLGLGDHRTRSCIEGEELETIKVVSFKFQVKNAYCFEAVSVLSSIQEAVANKQAFAGYIPSTDGEWRNFHVDQVGHHFATILTLSAKIGCSQRFLAQRLEQYEISSINPDGYEEYSYEEIIALPEFAHLLSLPHADEEGDWQGFVTDEQSRHWAVIVRISEKLSISEKFVRNVMSKYELEVKEIVTGRLMARSGYCIEDVLLLPGIQEEMNKQEHYS